MTKQEKIQEAYGDYWKVVKNHVDENGWCNCGMILKKDEFHFRDKNSNEFYRPNSIKGIENNNGWTKIESDNWLKKHKIDSSTSKYYVDDIDEDYLTINVLVSGKGETEQLTIQGYLYIANELKKDGIIATHYQAVVKPKNPIY